MQESLWKKSLAAPRNVKEQTAAHQGIYPRVMQLVFTQNYTEMFIAILFRTAKYWK